MGHTETIRSMLFSELLDKRVAGKGQFAKDVQHAFQDAITRAYILEVHRMEGLTSAKDPMSLGGGDRGAKAEVARRIGVSPGQVSRWVLGQRPSLDHFCLRSASQDIEFPRGAIVAFTAYCEAYRMTAIQMQRGEANITAEQACCLYFTVGRWRSRFESGRYELDDETCSQILEDIKSYFCDGDETVHRCDHLRIKSVRDVRGTVSGRLEIWVNTAFLLNLKGTPNDWY